jgi:hypothetical protein
MSRRQNWPKQGGHRAILVQRIRPQFDCGMPNELEILPI